MKIQFQYISCSACMPKKAVSNYFNSGDMALNFGAKIPLFTKYTGFPFQEENCHVFVERSHRQLSLLYRTGSEYHLESRRLNTGLYRLHREEVSSGFLPIPWSRLNEFLTLHKPSRKQAWSDL